MKCKEAFVIETALRGEQVIHMWLEWISSGAMMSYHGFGPLTLAFNYTQALEMLPKQDQH